MSLIIPKPSAVACLEAFHQMVVEDSGYRVCTLLAHPQEPTTFPVHIISHAATALPNSILEELRTFFSSKLGHQSLPDQNAEDGPELEADGSDQIELDAIELELAKELEVAAEEDPATQAFHNGKHMFFKLVVFILFILIR